MNAQSLFQMGEEQAAKAAPAARRVGSVPVER